MIDVLLVVIMTGEDLTSYKISLSFKLQADLLNTFNMYSKQQFEGLNWILYRQIRMAVVINVVTYAVHRR